MKRVLLPGLVVATLLLGACAGAEGETATAGSGTTYRVENCGNSWELDAVPQRIVMQDVSAARTIAELGMLDKVVAKAGYFPEEYFDAETFAKIDSIKTLSGRLGEAGHLDITKEAVLAENPDIIIGVSNSVNADTVDGIPVINEPGFCGEVKDASFEHVYEEVDLYATIFQAKEAGEQLKEQLKERVAKVDSSVGEGRTVAVLYPAVKGSSVYAYGADSMSNPIVEAVGLENVFGDQQERVFEISAEQLVAKNPDVILLLHASEDDLESYVTELPGSAGITAVKEGKIIPMLLAQAEPPTPMAVDGLERLHDALKEA